jgi:hypothetical protein
MIGKARPQMPCVGLRQAVHDRVVSTYSGAIDQADMSLV